MTFFENKISERLGGKNFGKTTEIYKFELIKRAKAEAKKNNPDTPLIDMGVGEPDWPADSKIVDVLSREAGLPENRWYADNGIPEFQIAAAEYLKKVYGLNGIDPLKQIVHGIGSKPILAMLPLCFINPGDIHLTTTPGYPVMATHTRYLGGEVFNLPLCEENGFLPDFTYIPPTILKRAKTLYLCYPNNPTGATATEDFFKDVVEFAIKNGIVVIHDAAYGALTYGEYKPLSFLSIKDAINVGIEVHSLSKAFNMTGWRMGFVCGNAEAVKAYATVKDNTDSGQFRGIQKAAIKALNSIEITQKTIEKYSRRFDLLIPALEEIGFKAKKPKGSFYCYVKAPVGTEDGLEFKTATDFSTFLIRSALISTVPWDDVGQYIRFSVTFSAETNEEEKNIIEEMKRRMKKLRLIF
jgi:LL-diaminopimelate aminotransferase